MAMYLWINMNNPQIFIRIAPLIFHRHSRAMASSGVMNAESGILSIVFSGDDSAALAEITRLASLVGVEVTHLSQHDRTEGVLKFSSDTGEQQCVSAEFHPLFAPYFSKDRVVLNYRTQAERILELCAAVGTTIRGKVVGVIGVHGGVGASTLAITLAKILAKRSSHVAFVDANPASAGIELLIGIVDVPGNRWADLQGRGMLLPGKVNESLPMWSGVRVLSADERAGVPESGSSGVTALAALAQVNQWTIVDLPPAALVPSAGAHSYLEWCDYLFVLTAPDAVHTASTHTLIAAMASNVKKSIVAMNVSSKNHAAHVAQSLGVKTVHAVPYAPEIAAAFERGLPASARHRTKFYRRIHELCDFLEHELE